VLTEEFNLSSATAGAFAIDGAVLGAASGAYSGFACCAGVATFALN